MDPPPAPLQILPSTLISHPSTKSMDGHSAEDTDESALEWPASRLTRLREYFDQDVTESWADAMLIVTCFITGLLDSAVFNVWSCFVSMQTGNTVYVGLGVSGQPHSQPYRWVKSLTAILCFMLGTFIFSRSMRFLGPLRRKTIISSLLLQALLCFLSAILGVTGVVPPEAGNWIPENFIVLVPLAMLSCQSAGQIVLSRFLGYSEITTVVLTSAYCDLILDPDVFKAPLKADVKRNRRAFAALSLALGAVLGGFLTKGGDITFCLWIAGAMKVAIALAYVFWKSKAGVHLE